jgi:hypothetical protein
MASGAVHFFFDAIASLVALDENDGLLNFKAASRFFEPQKEIRNAPILLSLVICARVLQVLVSMIVSEPTECTLSNDRYDMSSYAFLALLSLWPALMTAEGAQRMKRTIPLWSVRASSPHFAA